MNNIQEFTFNDNVVRTVNYNNEAWFIASDVCDILELSNITEALRGLDDDEKAEFNISEVSSNSVKQARKRMIVNEPGLYSLILRSRKSEDQARSARPATAFSVRAGKNQTIRLKNRPNHR